MSNNISGKEKLEMQLSQKQEIDMNFDKTFFCKILKNSTGVSETLTEAEKATLTDCDEFYYYVKIYGKFYKIKCADSNFIIDEDVRVKIPNNNWDRMYIDFRKGSIPCVSPLNYIQNGLTVTLTWKLVSGLDGIMIFKKEDNNFSSIFDGEMIYQGNAEIYIDTLDYDFKDYYYRCISYKGNLYNANCEIIKINKINDKKTIIYYDKNHIQINDSHYVHSPQGWSSFSSKPYYIADGKISNSYFLLRNDYMQLGSMKTSQMNLDKAYVYIQNNSPINFFWSNLTPNLEFDKTTIYLCFNLINSNHTLAQGNKVWIKVLKHIRQYNDDVISDFIEYKTVDSINNLDLFNKSVVYTVKIPIDYDNSIYIIQIGCETANNVELPISSYNTNILQIYSIWAEQ